MEQKVIVLYGGSFNPPSNSHMLLAKGVIDEYNMVEKIVFMPVSTLYKKQGLAYNEHRYNMLKLMCNKEDKFEVSNLEIDNPRQLHTIETLKLLQEQYADYAIWLMIGTDNLKELHTWKEPELLLQEHKVFVLKRDNENIDKIIENSRLLSKYKDSFIKCGNQDIQLSATKVREKIANKEDAKDLLSKEVYDYIKEFKLYEKEED